MNKKMYYYNNNYYSFLSIRSSVQLTLNLLLKTHYFLYHFRLKNMSPCSMVVPEFSIDESTNKSLK